MPPARGPILVCGLGHVGYRSVRLLRRLGLAVTAVDVRPRSEWVEELEREGVRVVVGDACNEGVLRDAGLTDAAALLAITDQDGVNTEVILDASRVRPGVPLVLRVFDLHLAQQLASVLDLRCAAGVSTLAAPSFAAAAWGEEVVASFVLRGVVYSLGYLQPALASPPPGFVPLVPPTDPRPGLVLAPHGHWREHRRAPPSRAGTLPGRKHASRGGVGSATRRLRLRGWWHHTSPPLRAVLVALATLVLVSGLVFRFTLHLSTVDALYFLVTTLTTTGYGDITPATGGPAVKLYACVVMLLGSAMTAILYALLTEHLVAARFRALFTSRPVPDRDHVIVVGLGNVGYRVVDELRAAGVPVVAVTQDDDGEFVAAVRKQHALVVGDARLPEILLAAGVETAAAVVAVTGEDTVNLSVVLAARRYRPGVRTVVRIFDEDFAMKVRSALRVDEVLSASAIAAPTFAAAALFADVKASLPTPDALLVLCETELGAEAALPSSLAGYPAHPLLHGPANGRPFGVYDAATPLGPGDRLLVAVRVPWKQQTTPPT